MESLALGTALLQEKDKMNRGWNGNWETDAKVTRKRNYEIKLTPIKELAPQQQSKCVCIFLTYNSNCLYIFT